jgi:chemotaxis methyl-accepting protein methylase
MTSLGRAELRPLRAWIQRSIGLRGEDYRDSFLTRRLEPRLQATGCADAAAYVEHVKRHTEEAQTFLSKLMVPTTEFFRNPEVFEALSKILAGRAQNLGWEPLRILSTPCSTGEEVLSLAILLEEAKLDGRIVAGDLSLSALRRLKSGTYPTKGLEGMDIRQKERYFTVEENRARPVRRLTRRVLPVRCDLTQALPGRGFHLVLLRNLFIYLTETAQARLLGEAARALVPGGLLVLGRVESVSRSGHGLFRPLARDARIYEKAD